jgi:metallophosphoesterase superfamily enzyme
MKPDDSIVVIGDIHGEFGKLNTLVSYKRPEIILQVGDFGYWPKHISKRERKRGTPLLPKMHDTKLYWVDGNHEDFDSLMERGDNEILSECIPYEAWFNARTSG